MDQLNFLTVTSDWTESCEQEIKNKTKKDTQNFFIKSPQD
jgi:hypothetical protein